MFTKSEIEILRIAIESFYCKAYAFEAISIGLKNAEKSLKGFDVIRHEILKKLENLDEKKEN